LPDLVVLALLDRESFVEAISNRHCLDTLSHGSPKLR